MYMKWKNAVALSIFLSLFISSSTSLQFQTLFLKPPNLPNSEPKYKPEFDKNDLSMGLQLHQVDKLRSDYSNLTPKTRLQLRLQRDLLRVQKLASRATGGNHHRHSFNSSTVSGIQWNSGEFFTRIGFGTPAKYFYMVLDTGSDIIWLQCAPCKKCYSQMDPLFRPSRSTSYKRLNCGSRRCRQLDSRRCGRKNRCIYGTSYGDSSFSVGYFSTETLTLRRQTVSEVAFGCGRRNEGLFSSSAGLLGLGRGSLSFPVQAGSLFGSKFSYCLVDWWRSSPNASSHILFGETAASRRAVFTPLVDNPNRDLSTFYYVKLNGISVGSDRINTSEFEMAANGDGGVIVDSGTSVSRLVRSAYEALRNAFRSRTAKLKRVEPFSLFDTCYDFSGLTQVRVPSVVLHFAGADVNIPAGNFLIPVDVEKGTFCFAFAAMEGSKMSIIGNIQQQGFRVSFDLEKKRVGFAGKSCGETV